MKTNEAIDLVQQGKNNYYNECFSYAKRFIQRQKGKFTSEDMIYAYSKTTQPQPKELRVWGAVMRELKSLGLITNAGFSIYKKPCGHSKPVNVWKKALKSEK